MYFISLFELLLVVFAFYAAVQFEGTTKWAVLLLSLLAVFLLERLDKRIQEDEEVRERLQRYKIEGRKKKGEGNEFQHPRSKEVEGAFKSYNLDEPRKKRAVQETGTIAKDEHPA